MRRSFLALALLAVAGPVWAQGAKPIEIIVPFAPGASADGIARVIGNDLGIRLKRPVVIESKPGGGGTLGLALLARATPDGDTLAVGATGALLITPNLPGATGLDPLRELTPIAKLIEIPIVVVANADSGPKTIAEMLARAKASPNGLSYGSTGTNSGQHLIMEFLKRATGANLVHVPYRGSTPAVTDLLGGQIPVASVDLTSALPHIRSGRLIALGVPTAQRTSLAPDIPTIAEAGVPGFARTTGFIGLFAPAGTPAATVARLSRDVGAVLATPEAHDKVSKLAAEVTFEDNVTFAKFLTEESARWKEALAGMPASN
jgi:tripartite-type tricarboxylate transporter receptor subunit TctC